MNYSSTERLVTIIVAAIILYSKGFIVDVLGVSIKMETPASNFTKLPLVLQNEIYENLTSKENFVLESVSKSTQNQIKKRTWKLNRYLELRETWTDAIKHIDPNKLLEITKTSDFKNLSIGIKSEMVNEHVSISWSLIMRPIYVAINTLNYELVESLVNVGPNILQQLKNCNSNYDFDVMIDRIAFLTPKTDKGIKERIKIMLFLLQRKHNFGNQMSTWRILYRSLDSEMIKHLFEFYPLFKTEYSELLFEISTLHLFTKKDREAQLVIIKMLVEHGADVCADMSSLPDNGTMLHKAVSTKNVPLLKFLLSLKKINPEQMDRGGHTAMFLAFTTRRRFDLEITEELIAVLSSYNADIHTVSNTGESIPDHLRSIKNTFVKSFLLKVYKKYAYISDGIIFLILERNQCTII